MLKYLQFLNMSCIKGSNFYDKELVPGRAVPVGCTGFPHAQVQCLVKVTFKTHSKTASSFSKSLKTQCFYQFVLKISENVSKYNDLDPILIKKHENTMLFNIISESN